MPIFFFFFHFYFWGNLIFREIIHHLIPVTKSRAAERAIKPENGQYELFDFSNPPKILEIKAITLESRGKRSRLPNIVIKQTIASLAKRYVKRFREI